MNNFPSYFIYSQTTYISKPRRVCTVLKGARCTMLAPLLFAQSWLSLYSPGIKSTWVSGKDTQHTHTQTSPKKIRFYYQYKCSQYWQLTWLQHHQKGIFNSNCFGKQLISPFRQNIFRSTFMTFSKLGDIDISNVIRSNSIQTSFDIMFKC